MSSKKSILFDHIKKIEVCKEKEELFEILSDARKILINNMSFSGFISKNKTIIEKVKEICLYNDSVKESVYRLINKIDYDVLCKCGKRCSFLDNNRGYQKFCGDRKCKYVNEKRVENSNKTFESKYGCHPMKTTKTKNKLKQSVMEKYGHENIMKYFSENNMVNSPFRLQSVKDKIKDTFDKKYGGHPMQTDECFENNLKSRVKFKDFTLPSGKIIRLQGYEVFGIKYLLDKYDEKDILSSVKEINKEIGFIYYKYKGRKKKYYTDFYIKSENKIYEVKSTWTYSANIEKNKAKRKACEQMGIKFEFLIFNSDGKLINGY